MQINDVSVAVYSRSNGSPIASHTVTGFSSLVTLLLSIWSDWRMAFGFIIELPNLFSSLLLPVFSGSVGHCALLAVGVNVAVRSVTGAIGVGLFLEVGSVLLCVRSSELAIAAQVPLLADNGSGLGIHILVLAISHGDKCANHQRLSRVNTKHWGGELG